MSKNENWLGVKIDFGKVEDKSSTSEFELMLEGLYPALIKKVHRGVLGANEKQALIVTLELEDGKKEFIHSLFLPENGDSESAIKFKNENLRNFFSRTLFSGLSYEEYSALEAKTKAEAFSEMQTSAKGEKQFEGKKVLVNIKQEPFISRDRDTQALVWTNVDYNSQVNRMPKTLLTMFSKLEDKGIELDKMPLVLFSNKVSAFGFGFYSDFNTETKYKNSKTFEFIDSLHTDKALESATEEALVEEVVF